MRMTICLDLPVPRNMAAFMYRLIRQLFTSLHEKCWQQCGKMILGSDSHTRYGALGTMAMGEGGPELVKQLLSQTYDINMPGVVAIYLKGVSTARCRSSGRCTCHHRKSFRKWLCEEQGNGVRRTWCGKLKCRFPYRC